MEVNGDSRDGFQFCNIDDILEEREGEVRNEANWIDGERKEFLRDYNNIPPPPRRGPQLRERGSALHITLRRSPIPPQPRQGGQNGTQIYNYEGRRAKISRLCG